ncbi:hypothetical protein L1887_40457 [Cichorium endivia]|nr:hypothetical protein L1887_40457 [Cichorium endivia]
MNGKSGQQRDSLLALPNLALIEAMAPLHHAPLRISKAKWSGGQEPVPASQTDARPLAKGELHLQKVAATNGYELRLVQELGVGDNCGHASPVDHDISVQWQRPSDSNLEHRPPKLRAGPEENPLQTHFSRHPATFRARLASSSALHRLFISKAYKAHGCAKPSHKSRQPCPQPFPYISLFNEHALFSMTHSCKAFQPSEQTSTVKTDRLPNSPKLDEHGSNSCRQNACERRTWNTREPTNGQLGARLWRYTADETEGGCGEGNMHAGCENGATRVKERPSKVRPLSWGRTCSEGHIPRPAVLLEALGGVGQQDATALLHVHREVRHLLPQLGDRLGLDRLLELLRQILHRLFQVALVVLEQLRHVVARQIVRHAVRPLERHAALAQLVHRLLQKLHLDPR